MTDDYEINSGVNVFDGTDKILENLSQAVAKDKRPRLTKLHNDVLPALNLGVIPTTSGNLLTAITARQDSAGYDVGIGSYSLDTTNGILGQTSQNTTGNKTIFTTSTTQRTFLTGVHMAYTASAAADNVVCAITLASRFGNNPVNTFAIRLEKQTLTATNDHIDIFFPQPIELIQGNAVLLASNFTVGAVTFSAVVFGYNK